jgi:hypothetical protein
LALFYHYLGGTHQEQKHPLPDASSSADQISIENRQEENRIEDIIAITALSRKNLRNNTIISIAHKQISKQREELVISDHSCFHPC